MSDTVAKEDWARFVSELSLLNPKQMAEEGAEIPLPVKYKHAWSLERDTLIEWATEFAIDASGIVDMLKRAAEEGLISDPRSTTQNGKPMRIHVLYLSRIQSAAATVEAPAEV